MLRRCSENEKVAAGKIRSAEEEVADEEEVGERKGERGKGRTWREVA